MDNNIINKYLNSEFLKNSNIKKIIKYNHIKSQQKKMKLTIFL